MYAAMFSSSIRERSARMVLLYREKDASQMTDVDMNGRTTMANWQKGIMLVLPC